MRFRRFSLLRVGLLLALLFALAACGPFAGDGDSDSAVPAIMGGEGEDREDDEDAREGEEGDDEEDDESMRNESPVWQQFSGSIYART